MDYGPEVEVYANKTVGVYGGKFFPFHKGHLSFIMEARKHVDVLFVVIQYDEEHERKLCEKTNFQYITPNQRMRWIAEETKNYSNVRVFTQYEHRSENHMNDPLITATYKELKETVGGHVDKIFSNTQDYTQYFRKYLPEAEHVVLYEKRDIYNISATQIRQESIFKNWKWLPKTVQTSYVKRIALCGVESVGKTYLSNKLATLLHTQTQEEHGRVFYEEINAYKGADLQTDYLNIAIGHCYKLNQAEKTANKILISDTDLIYTQMYHIQTYGYKDETLDVLIRNNADKIDVYLYLLPYNPHELDGTRLGIGNDERKQNNQNLINLYKEYGKKLTIIDEPNRAKRQQACLNAMLETIS